MGCPVHTSHFASGTHIELSPLESSNRDKTSRGIMQFQQSQKTENGLGSLGGDVKSLLLFRKTNSEGGLTISPKSFLRKSLLGFIGGHGAFHTMVVIVGLSAVVAGLSSCQSEMFATKQPGQDNHIGSSQSENPRSNVGALQSDSADDPPSVPQSVIKPGDQVQVMVWGHPEFNTTTTVKNYGTISVPLVGDVIAEGLSENQLASTLNQRLSEYIRGDVRVTISHVSMDNRISVMGAVNKQGNYSTLGDMSLVEVIADAGGTSTDADLRHVKIYRKGRTKDAVEVNLQKYLENGTVEDVPEVRPGDTVFVPAEENIIREIASYGQDILVLFGFFALLR